MRNDLLDYAYEIEYFDKHLLGRVEDDFISFIDFAPTFIEMAGLYWEGSGMHTASPGKSLAPIFIERNENRIKTFREFVVFGKEVMMWGGQGIRGMPVESV